MNPEIEARARLEARIADHAKIAVYGSQLSDDIQVVLAENARLREAATRAALCLSGFAGEGISIVDFEDPADVYFPLVEALGTPDASDDDLRAALCSTQEEEKAGALLDGGSNEE